MVRHQKSQCDAKQQSLLERVDALDEECDELQKQLEEKEDAQSSLNKRLQDIYKLKEQQEAQLSQQQVNESLQREKQTLQTHADELEKRVAQLTEHVNTLRERERLLVLFPELNDWAQTQPQSTGNLILDMEQQQQANSLRIKLLEQENATLQKSLEKLRQRQIFNSTRVRIGDNNLRYDLVGRKEKLPFNRKQPSAEPGSFKEIDAGIQKEAEIQRESVNQLHRRPRPGNTQQGR
uniref:Uncharacterized protein n=1 Tax=Cyprinodon variegatus TaxID=28743 RepID=A0A3Q2CE93_CYPVA